MKMTTGKVFIIGVGPGSREDITPRAKNCLCQVKYVIGQRNTIKAIKEIVPGNAVVIDRDMSPVERSRIAVEKAQDGENVALVSSGDPGIFAIASTFLTYLKRNKIKLPVEVIPGLTAAGVASALLGSPLGHDFAVISLTDRSTPWKEIKNRLEAAVRSHFVVVLYNPVRKTDQRRLREAGSILRSFCGGSRPVGIITRAGSENESVEFTCLEDLSHLRVAVDSLVIVGNHETFIYNKWMVTPRKYRTGIGY